LKDRDHAAEMKRTSVSGCKPKYLPMTAKEARSRRLVKCRHSLHKRATRM